MPTRTRCADGSKEDRQRTYVGARVVFHLGTEIKRAHELGSYRLEEKLGEGGMGEVWRAIPADLEALVLSCLAKDPSGRPQSARELSSKLAAVEGAGTWTQDRAREWWRMHRPAPTPETEPARG